MAKVIMEVTQIVTHKRQVEMDDTELQEFVDEFSEHLKAGKPYFDDSVGDWMGPGTEYDGEWEDASIQIIKDGNVVHTIE
ncbi:hypothetical protein [Desulfonatronovibrio hydrogenovorans]|uniref:hypothetical protein n=1 Tax=Desulfonatronovibrio hydrogenovorans TaxID=53245 RepID=UPI00048D9DC5|nr:hypothetical protein [Desulfonatronovibrio hydrogenovorans]